MTAKQSENLQVLARLAATIHQRAGEDSNASYTSSLLSQGTEKCAKKFGEEAIEFVLASLDQNQDHLVAEAADVLYHLLVVLEARSVSLGSVMDELERRTKQSGLQEKASRE